MIPKSTKWLPALWVALVAFGFVIVFLGGYEAKAPPKAQTIHVYRAPISPKATFAQVVANFSGKPYASGAIPELPGFTCHGWTNGANGSGWVVLRCSK